MAPGSAETLSSLKDHLKQHSSIKLYTPDLPEYDSIRECFVVRPARPFAIARPQTAEDVQALVQFSIEHNVDFSIRTGGHDSAGRSQIHGALMIDMRDINQVRVGHGGMTARVGGGILTGTLAEKLGEEGLVTACASIASVGHVGWCTLGGYGSFSTIFGLGADQIVGATLINARGDIVEATSDMLKGIRGGGGNFGVILELEIKVYPLKELLSSLLIYDSRDLTAAWAAYADNYNKLVASGEFPRALQLQPSGFEFPGMGKVLSVTATWADADHEAGRQWIDKVASWGSCVVKQVHPVTVQQYVKNNEQFVTWPSYGRGYTINIKQWTPKAAELMAKSTQQIPGIGLLVSAHTLRASLETEDSVFGSRQDHHLIEIISTTGDPDLEKQTVLWGQAVKQAFLEAEPENLLEGTYISLCGEDDIDLKKSYGDHYETLLELKRTYDPNNVFKYAIPRLPGTQ